MCIRDRLSENATKRVRSQLILEAIERQEKIDVSQEDIHAEITKLRPEATTPEQIEAELQKVDQEGFKRMIGQRKVFDFLVDHAKIKEAK